MINSFSEMQMQHTSENANAEKKSVSTIYHYVCDQFLALKQGTRFPKNLAQIRYSKEKFLAVRNHFQELQSKDKKS